MRVPSRACLLVLGFDGVLFFALKESALVTWLAERPLVVSRPVPELADALPDEFIARFVNVRRYARTLDELIVAWSEGAEAITNDASFTVAYRSFTPERVLRFVQRAQAMRHELRRRNRDSWLRAHRSQPECVGLIAAHRGPVAIVTSRDAESVNDLLDGHELSGHVDVVVGRCRDQASVVLSLADAHRVPVRHVCFIDDHLDNVLAVKAVGASAHWAAWGYHAPEHVARAQRAGVETITLDDLAAVSYPPTGVDLSRCHRRGADRWPLILDDGA